MRMWVGLAESSMIALSPSLASAATGIDYVAVGWEDTINSGKWMCCSGDGTNHTCMDMGMPAVSAGTEYLIDVDWSQTGKLYCRITANNKTYVTLKTSNLSTQAVGLGINITNTTKVTGGTSVCRNFYFAKGTLEQN